MECPLTLTLTLHFSCLAMKSHIVKGNANEVHFIREQWTNPGLNNYGLNKYSDPYYKDIYPVFLIVQR